MCLIAHSDSVLINKPSYLAGQMLQTNFSDVGDGSQAVALWAFPLIDGLSVYRVPQLLSALKVVFLVYLPWIHRGRIISKVNMNRALPLLTCIYVYIFFFLRMSELFDLHKVPRAEGLCLVCVTSHSSTCVRGVTSPCNEGVSLTLTAMWSRPRPGIQASGTSQRVTYLTHGHGTFLSQEAWAEVFSWQTHREDLSPTTNTCWDSPLWHWELSPFFFFPPTKMCLFFSFWLVGVFYSLPLVILHQHEPSELLSRIRLCYVDRPGILLWENIGKLSRDDRVLNLLLLWCSFQEQLLCLR